MPARPPLARRFVTAARWPPGIALTAWAYTWRITPLHRREEPGRLPDDAPPPLPLGTDLHDVQLPRDGSGALLRRRYRVDIAEAEMSAATMMERVRADIDVVAPSGLARFTKVGGDEDGPLRLGDEYRVHMPGPWDGPVRVIDVGPASFRFATLEGHLEAGQIEWRAQERGDAVRFEVESWSRPGDRLSAVLHHRLRMAKEVQLHMWISVLERATRLVGGRMRDGVDIHTRVID